MTAALTLQELQARDPSTVDVVERLRILLDVLHRVREEERPFNMTGWISISGGPRATKEGGVGAWECGTAGCAIGWAALDPRFQHLGLRVTEEVPGRTHSRDEILALRMLRTVEEIEAYLNEFKGEDWNEDENDLPVPALQYVGESLNGEDYDPSDFSAVLRLPKEYVDTRLLAEDEENRWRARFTYFNYIVAPVAYQRPGKPHDLVSVNQVIQRVEGLIAAIEARRP